MTEKNEEQHIHDSLEVIGLRAQGTAVGFLQLCTELLKAGAIDSDAMTRIKDAIIGEISLSRPRSASKEAFEESVRRRLDELLPCERAKAEHCA